MISLNSIIVGPRSASEPIYFNTGGSKADVRTRRLEPGVKSSLMAATCVGLIAAGNRIGRLVASQYLVWGSEGGSWDGIRRAAI